MNRNKFRKILGISATVIGAGFIISSTIAKKKKPESVYHDDPDQKNPFEGKKVIFVEDDTEPENADGVRGHLEAIGDSNYKESVYSRFIKRGLDVALSFGGLVLLSPVFLGISLAIKIDDPGPILFTQKRLGKNKQYFKLHKFRTMKMSTPHDVPTHQLENPEQYITKVGKFLRAHSLDELPQIWDIFIGNMSAVGPRPGLWNQDLLTAERDKYGANDVKPGLTGWAQINGRDELEIPDKAKFDGEYTEKIGLGMDIKCFLGSLHVFGKDDSVVEGGTGEMRKVGRHYTDGKSDADLIGNIGFGEPVIVDKDVERHVLITGAGSYIGESFRAYAADYYPSLNIEAIDMIDGSWRDVDFSSYDIIYHVAGIAHADVGNVDEATKAKYYAVNTDLTVEVCKKAKKEGVGRFIFMSSAIVYGESAPYGTQKIIDSTAVPHPANFYGDSKLQADVAVRDMADDNFKVIVLRPPMIYGRGSKGNYPTLAKIARKVPVFPCVQNERSMLHIDNLCEFLCQLMLIKKISRDAVVLIPQNPEWTQTAQMVKEIGAVSGKNIKLIGIANPAVAVVGKMPGKIGGLVNKAFGNMAYDQRLSKYDGLDYQVITLKESVERTEGNYIISNTVEFKPHVLLVSQYFYPENFRVNDIATEWVKRGYKVTVLTGIPNYPQGQYYDGYSKTEKREEDWNGIHIIRLPIEPRRTGSVNLAKNYMSFVAQGRKWVRNNNVKADIVFSYEVSPMTQALVSVWYSRKRNIPHVLYVTDLWPENVEIITGIHNKAFLGAIQKMVDYIYKNSSKILTSSNSFIKAIERRKVDKSKIEFWPQYAEDFYKPVDRIDTSEIPNDELCNFVFAGNIGFAQGLGILPTVAEKLKNENIRVRFNIIGDGRFMPELRELIKKLNVEEYFNFIERKPAEEIPPYLAAADGLLITLSKSEVFSITIPAKTQSCMACGKPILVSADGEVQEIIKEANAGLCSDSEDADTLADNIRTFLKLTKEERMRLGENALKYSAKHFNKNRLLDRIEEIFEEEINSNVSV